MSKVLVTGATGFVALHVIGQLLEKSYSVIGTVRSQAKADKLSKQFKAKFGDDVALELVIVEDIGAVGAFDSLFRNHTEIVNVLHTASPFSETKDDDFEKAYKIPALEGTTNVLNSIYKYGPQVKNVVITSSMAAIMNFDKLTDPTFIHTEDVWNPHEWEDAQENWVIAYCCSKKLAEKAAWNFAKENKVNFKVTVVNPPYIFGPQYFDEDAKADTLNTSAQYVKSLLDTDPNDTHLFSEPVATATDVRDVAAFHIIPLEREGVAGNRLFVVSGRFTLQGVLDSINKQFPELRGKIAKGDPANEHTIQALAWNSDKTNKLVGGYNFNSLDKMIHDAIKQILDVRKN